jgi:hypothetical protein
MNNLYVLITGAVVRSFAERDTYLVSRYDMCKIKDSPVYVVP